MEVRVIGWLAVGTVLGFAMGGFGPRLELQRVRAERDELEQRLQRIDRPNPLAAFLPQLERIRPMPTPMPAPNRNPGAGPITPSKTVEADSADTTPAPGRTPEGSVAVIGATEPADDRDEGRPARVATNSDAASVTPGEPNPPDEDAPETRPRRGRPQLEDFERLASLQRARAAASRSALIAQADLNDEQVAAVDTTLTRMNDRLMGYGEEVITQMGSEEPPKPAAVLGLGHDVSGVLYEGQQDLDRIVGEAGTEVDPEALQIWNYVDVEQWRPFVDAQIKAQGGAGPAPIATPDTPAPTSGTGGATP